jgi:hypothetical protein
MKYAVEILIDRPLHKAVEFFDNRSNLVHWTKGLKSFEANSGVPGQPGWGK